MANIKESSHPAYRETQELDAVVSNFGKLLGGAQKSLLTEAGNKAEYEPDAQQDQDKSCFSLRS